MKSLVPASAMAAVISVTSTMAHALCHRAFASCSRSISVSFSLLLPTYFPHSKFSFFCTSANTPYIKRNTSVFPSTKGKKSVAQIYSYSTIFRRENQVYFRYTHWHLCANMWPPPTFLVNLTNSTEFDSNLCNYFALFDINTPIFCSIVQIYLFTA